MLTDDGRHSGCTTHEAAVIVRTCGARIVEPCKAEARAALDVLALGETPPPIIAAGLLEPGQYCAKIVDGRAEDCTLQETVDALNAARPAQ